jgi:hypothetical protein
VGIEENIKIKKKIKIDIPRAGLTVVGVPEQ